MASKRVLEEAGRREIKVVYIRNVSIGIRGFFLILHIWSEMKEMDDGGETEGEKHTSSTASLLLSAMVGDGTTSFVVDRCKIL